MNNPRSVKLVVTILEGISWCESLKIRKLIFKKKEVLGEPPSRNHYG